MHLTKLIIRFYGTALKSMLEFRLVMLMDIFTMIMTYSVGYLSIWILLSKFQTIRGWTLYEIILLFNFNMVASGISYFFMRWPMLDMERMIRQGDFDIVLIRPMNSLIFTVIGRPTFALLGNLILGAFIFALCFTHLAINLSVLKVFFILLAILGATLIQAAILLIVGALSFWVVKTFTTYSMINSLNNFIDYPITIYGKIIQVAITFLVPFAFINYYPVYYFLDKTGDNLFFPILQYGTPVVGLVLFFLAYQFWRVGVNKYESTGS